HHSISSAPTELDWTDYVELMPVRDEKKRKHLERRILKEGLRSKEIREEVRPPPPRNRKRRGAGPS
ncbi:MAG: hypothetical protein KAR31_00620, partial [Candidatus Omnitrophica bacterium]|nr:hypothetical protein [Candidatus Omnitrophota bacterium]